MPTLNRRTALRVSSNAPAGNALKPLGNVTGLMSVRMGVMKQHRHAAPTARRLKEALPAPMDNASWPLGNAMGSMSAPMGATKQCQCAAPTARK